ncbi:spore coat protein [Salirhabdus salicampi]|uniref:spore coat protein n=1 Tax=Salirhabdus salicampi TaxID=476102 RepID=UPI0020C427A7|nr:spore coat protein [Salirhabdus salicampi]MCP8618131.1 spore coat protein [Salirhabdus salicampi]
MEQQKTLAWHESLELHELVVFKSVGLVKMKTSVKMLKDKETRELFQKAIQVIESELKELMKFYQNVPQTREDELMERNAMENFMVGDLLAFMKTGVRNYAIAITETATPKLKEVLIKQLNSCIQLHDQVYRFMYKKGLYPSYDINKLFENDLKLAKQALSM